MSESAHKCENNEAIFKHNETKLRCKSVWVLLLKSPILVVSVYGEIYLAFLDFLQTSFITSTTGDFEFLPIITTISVSVRSALQGF